MRNRNHFDSTLSVIFRNKGRSFLVVLALALGMGCMLVMEAISAGGEAQFLQSVSSGDPLEILVSPGASQASGTVLNDAAVQSFLQVAGVQAATGVLSLPLQVSIGGYRADSLEVMAVDPDALLGKLEFKTGGMFSPQSTSPQIVLGFGAQMQFKGGKTQQGSAVEQDGSVEPTPPPLDWLGKGAQFSIVEPGQSTSTDGTEASGSLIRTYAGSITGILKENKSDRNGKAFMSLTAAKKILRENFAQAQALGLSVDSYTQAYVFAKDMASVKAVEDGIAGMGFAAQSDEADLDGLLEEQALRKTLLVVIEVFSAVVGALLALCIMLAGGRGEQKAKEEPSARALPGYATLGLLGGLASVLLASLFALIVNTSSAETVVFGLHFGQSSNVVIPFGAALLAMGISIAAALLTGWISQAAKPREEG